MPSLYCAEDRGVSAYTVQRISKPVWSFTTTSVSLAIAPYCVIVLLLIHLFASNAAAEVLFLDGQSQGDIVTFIILSILKLKRETSSSSVVSLNMAGAVKDSPDLTTIEAPMVSKSMGICCMFTLKAFEGCPCVAICVA